jgi:hypothetical protein
MADVAQETMIKAVAANLAALEERLFEAAKLAQEASAAMNEGQLNLAIGTALPLEQILVEAKALHHAAMVLARAAR